MHGNMVFSMHYILGTPQQSGGFLVCSVNRNCFKNVYLAMIFYYNDVFTYINKIFPQKG